jgi:hypothetical protein
LAYRGRRGDNRGKRRGGLFPACRRAGTETMQYRKKPVVIEAITFDELIAYGKANGSNIVNDMPWSFDYAGHPITHENDDCYLIPTLEGVMKFTRSDMLITGVNGEIYPCKIDIFAATYEPVEDCHGSER